MRSWLSIDWVLNTHLNSSLTTNAHGACGEVVDVVGDFGDDLAVGLEVLGEATAIRILASMDETRNAIALLDRGILDIGTELLDHAAEVAAGNDARRSEEGDMLPVGRVESDGESSDQDLVLVQARNGDFLDLGLLALDGDKSLHLGWYRHVCLRARRRKHVGVAVRLEGGSKKAAVLYSRY